MADISVRYEGGDRFAVAIRGHELLVDQPVDDGGEDLGPTPTELFVTGLAACVSFYAERYLKRHDLPVDGLAVDCDYHFAGDRPTRVGDIRLRVALPQGFPEDRRDALQAVVEHCTVHNSIRRAPMIEIRLEAASRAA